MKKATLPLVFLLTAALLVSMVACQTTVPPVVSTPDATTTASRGDDSTTLADVTTTTAGQEGNTTSSSAPVSPDAPSSSTESSVTQSQPTTSTQQSTTSTEQTTVTTTTKKPTTTTTTTKKPTTTTTTKKPTTTTTTKKPTTTTTTKKPTTTTTTKTPAVDVPVINDGLHINFRDTSANGGSVGVWWWSSGDATNASRSTQYLQFLKDNQVSEIYLCADGMSNAQIATFIRKAATYGMRVAWLSGDASWINSQSTAIATKYLNYQAQAAADAKFYALHLDVEPHQLSGFSGNRATIMQNFAQLVGKIATMLHNAGEKIEWDIPFWLEGEAADRVTMGGKTMGIISYIASVSDTLCLMSYRDTASQILSVSAEEIAAAKQYGCKVVCGVETYSQEGDAVSFMEEGKAEMCRQLKTVYQTLATKGLAEYGIAVHYVPQWYSLKN